MSKLSFRARALDASKPMPIYLAEELPDLPDYSAINRAVPQMPSGMEKEEESEHHLQRAISGTGLIIPTPEVCQVNDIEFYETCYPPDYKMPKQHIHMQPLWEEQETPEYDIDSEDERWLKQQRHPELTELKFEQMMDKLEKSSGQTVVTLNEAKILLERHDDLIIAVYDYWLNKRLTTQHPLILSVKTEHRPGQSTNNPYLAFRRRTEKMQTRKNRKNDESSYEKMLKLRRDLARALNLLELVARRERAKTELVKLTALLAERRYAAGDFANQLLPDPPPRPAYTVPVTSSSFRREAYTAPAHYPPRLSPQPVDTPRQREKRPYKRRKHRHAPPAAARALRDSGVYTSSEEEGGRVETTSPPDDGPFAFRRKPGCFYEMPTSTLSGDPVEGNKQGLFQHEIDPRHRFTLTSIREPYRHYIGFARRRVTRGGRLALDRVATPLDDLWTRLPVGNERETFDEMELEKNRYRTPKEISRDYHTSGKYPWRHAFRRHLSRNPDLWLADPAPHLKLDPEVKVKLESDLPDVIQDSVKSDSVKSDNVKSDISVRTMDCPSTSGKRKRYSSDCSDSSYDSDDSLQPVEKEFEKFIDEVNNEWLHFRPKTPPPSPPPQESPSSPLSLDTAISIELLGSAQPSQSLPTFTTSQFTLGQLYPEMDGDNTAHSLDVSNDDCTDNFTGLTEAQVESILSETDLQALADNDDKKMNISDDILDVLVGDVDKDPFLLSGDGRQDSVARKRKTESFGSSRVRVRQPTREPIHIPLPTPTQPPTPTPTPKPTPAPQPTPKLTPVTISTPAALYPPAKPKPIQKTVQAKPDVTLVKIKPALAPPPAPVPTSNIIVEEVNDLTLNYEHKKEDTIEEHVQLSHGVQLKTVQTRHSPLKKHIITSGARPLPAVSSVSPAPQIVTVAVSDQLKVRLQNHLLSSQSGVLVQNGPFSPVVAVPVHSRETVVSGVSSSPSVHRRGPLVALSTARTHTHTHPTPLVVTQPHIHNNKLKLIHAHPLTHTQRTQLLQTRTQMPTVVSLATIDPKNTNTALLKAAPGSVAQLFEIKSGQLGKGAHLVNVVRHPQPGKTTVTRLDLNDKKRQVVFDGTLKGNIATTTRPHRVQVSLDGRQIVRAALPSVRAPIRQQFQLKNRPVQVAPQLSRSLTEPSTSITIPQSKQIPSSVVTNLLHKNIQLPKGGQKIAISGGQALSANVQAITFSAAHVKARQARLIAQPRPPPTAETVDTTTPVATTSQQDSTMDPTETESNGTVRRRATDTLPMEVT